MLTQQMKKYTPWQTQKSMARARVGAQSGLGPGPGWGPYGPLWALMGPYGSSWTGPDMTKSGLSVEFDTFRVQKWYFDEMTY